MMYITYLYTFLFYNTMQILFIVLLSVYVKVWNKLKIFNHHVFCFITIPFLQFFDTQRNANGKEIKN